jgi:hypothetical protein
MFIATLSAGGLSTAEIVAAEAVAQIEPGWSTAELIIVIKRRVNALKTGARDYGLLKPIRRARTPNRERE